MTRFAPVLLPFLFVGSVDYVQDDGTPLTRRNQINFTSNITCADDAANNRTNCSATDTTGAPSDADYVTGSSNGSLSAERVATDTASVDVNTATPGQMKWDVLPAGVTLAGDVDGAGNATDIDEAAIESEVESVVDLADLQGALPLAKLTDDGTGGLCLQSGGAGGDPAWGSCSAGGGYATIRDNGSAETQRTQLNILSGTNISATCADDGATPETDCTFGITGQVAIANGGTGQASAAAGFNALAPTTTQGDTIYRNGSGNNRLPIGIAGQSLKVDAAATAPEWGFGHLTAQFTGDLPVAVSASYVTVTTISPIASKRYQFTARYYHTASATTVGLQFRVKSTDAVGTCLIAHFGVSGTASSATTVEQDAIAIAAAPADDAVAAAFSTAMNRVDVDCNFTTDASPDTVVVEAQLETGTSSINILKSSYYALNWN